MVGIAALTPPYACYAPTDMAFVHRGYSMITSAELEWSPADAPAVLAKNQQWLSRFHDRMEQYTSEYC